MKKLIDLNRGSVFEDKRGMVGSAPYKLGEQKRQGPQNVDLNSRAIYHQTGQIHPSKPLHSGRPTLGQEKSRLTSTYSLAHGPKLRMENTKRGARKVKASSRGLLLGTDEEAEDLTGQRAPISSSRWKSEVRDQFQGCLNLRPLSAPNQINYPLSLMDNQEPVFGHTKSYASRHHQMQELLPFCPGVQSHLQDLDVYQSTYSLE
ncbi:uncharacterized protein LOC111716187 [Eurytemora carolleeae]|uniref:uncharacterized protein LOC111716187 n=1 Tax=Eurytemora carolleeae TaxID=1294199 RepID=UPI000C75D524|nr:uncharacterized protein LOC111716187 [Eurytemora carolleeae]|eukprot:XP_023347387.1 uncharacterized protein LOC111716187 [Eurytemora affinis]